MRSEEKLCAPSGMTQEQTSKDLESHFDHAKKQDYDWKMENHVSVLETRFDLILPTLATKLDLVELRSELKSEMGELRSELKSEMGELRSELKSEMGELRSELKSEMGELRSELKLEMSELRAELKSDMGELRLELKSEIGESRASSKSELQKVHTDIVRWMLATTITMILAMLGINANNKSALASMISPAQTAIHHQQAAPSARLPEATTATPPATWQK